MISFASSNLVFAVNSAFSSNISCLSKSFVSFLLLQPIKMKNASTLTVLMIDFNMVVFLVKISQLLKLKLIKIQYVLITLGGK
jgi:hypothetical protein